MAFALMSMLLVLQAEARAPNSNINNHNGDEKEPPGMELAETKDKKTIINLRQNYQSSSAVTKKLEDDFKARWRRTFEEIKESNPVVFPPAGSAEERLTRIQRPKSGEKIVDTWKQFLDVGGGSTASAASAPIPPSEGEKVPPNAGGKGRQKKTPASKTTNIVPPPTRFDGFQTWDKQLQQWAEDVSLYLTDTESQINTLLQPKEPSLKYDLSSYGFTSQDSSNKKNLTREEVDTEGSPLITRKAKKPKKKGALATTDMATLPISLTALDKTLPPIPKPRPVTPSDDILPHTDIADKSKNIWIVTTGALPWMTGTSVNPLLRAAYLSTGRKDAEGSVTLLLPWVERAEVRSTGPLFVLSR